MNPFTLPNLPTDNLYKFYSLSGIVIVLFTITFGVFILNNLDEKSHEIKESIVVSKIKLDHLKEDYKLLEIQMDNIDKELKEYFIKSDTIFDKMENAKEEIKKLKSDSDYREFLEFYYKYEYKLIPEIDKMGEIAKLRDKYFTNQREYQIKEAELNSKKEELSDNFKIFDTFFISGVVFTFYGLFLSFYGFKKWRLNVQNLIDKKLEIELRILENEEKKILPKKDKTV